MRPQPNKPVASSSAKPSASVFGPERILFEDEWLIAVDKPAGLPSDRTLDPKRASLLSELEAFLSKRDNNPKPYLALHHRLDRDTSGVILLTKHPKANAGTGALFAQKTAQKTYQALSLLAQTRVEDSWEIRNYLAKTGTANKAAKFGAVRSGGDPAHTDFRILARLGQVLHVEALPRTGRTHQIRVHLAEAGLPILGDELYGGPLQLRRPDGTLLHFPRFFLHAIQLEFPHPLTQAPVSIRCPLPADFEACLQILTTLRTR